MLLILLEVRLMVFNSIFNNISYSRGTQFYRVEETGVPGENHRPVASHRQTLSRNVIFIDWWSVMLLRSKMRSF
jgi:hypothetical protein